MAVIDFWFVRNGPLTFFSPDPVLLLGGLLGSGLGVGAVMAVAAFTPLPASIGVVSVLGTVLLSGSIGLFFGVVPARRAAQLDPIVALRRL